MPVIRNTMIMLLSNKDYEFIRTRQGKEALRMEVLEEIQGVLREQIGSPGIEAVYFTNFMVQ